MSDTPPLYPHLEERLARRRERRRRSWLGVGIISGVILLTVLILAANAGRWGVPLFGFTNEFGSKCRNDWLGHTCRGVTLKEIAHHTGIAFPEGTTIVSATSRKTHEAELTARVVYPATAAPDVTARLRESFGDCRPDAPSPLRSQPGLTDLCVMTNEGVDALGAPPSTRTWRIATATQPDGAAVADIHLRTR